MPNTPTAAAIAAAPVAAPPRPAPLARVRSPQALATLAAGLVPSGALAAVAAASVLGAPVAFRSPAALAMAAASVAGAALAAAAARAVARLSVDRSAARGDAAAAATALERAAARHALLEAAAARVEQAAEAAQRTKSDFLANMSHEIRTPMAAVLGYADLLLDPALAPDERLAHVETIRRNGEQLLTLINDVLDFSKVEAGMMTVEHIACSPLQLLDDVATLLGARATGKGLGFGVTFSSPMPERITSDPVRFRQILTNLVGNAIKFTAAGSVRMSARCELADPRRPRLVVDVIDTGIGLDGEQIARLFQPFSQADSSTTRRFGGTGLGLAICARLAELLGGRITVTSAPGQGSTFSLAIDTGPLDGVTLLSPGDPAQARARGSDPLTASVEAPPQHVGGRVLLAEDGHDNQVLLTTHLKKAGCAVTVVENGVRAVEQAQAALAGGEPYDVILMDMQMPELDGYGAVARLRGDGYRGPIVAVTAHAMVGDRERCIAAGCDDYLTKPVRRPVLLAMVARHVAPRPVAAIASVRPASLPADAPVAPRVAAPGLAAVTAPPAPAGDGLWSSYADDPDMAEIVDRFVGEMPARVAALREAGRRPHQEQLRRLAHQIKGAAGGYGFHAITQAAGRLEHGIQQQVDPEESARRLDELIALCERVRAGRPPNHAIVIIERRA